MLCRAFLRRFTFSTLRMQKISVINPYYKCTLEVPLKCFPQLYSQQSSIEEIIVDFEYVKKSTANKDILIVDVREPDEIKEHGKIPNSINIPLGKVSSVLSTMPDKEFAKMYGRKKPSEDAEIIFYCMIGKRSGMAQQNAINLGYKRSKNYLGSWTEWANKNA